MAYFIKSAIKNTQTEGYTVDTLGRWGEAQEVKGESQRNGFVHPEEDSLLSTNT